MTTDVKFKRIVTIGSVCVAVISIAGLLEYTLHLQPLGSIRRGYIPMAPATASCFLILCAVLFAHSRKPLEGVRLITARALIILATVFCLLELFELFGGIDLNFSDRLFPPKGTLGTIPIGKMSPATAITFAIAGIGLLLVLCRNAKDMRIRGNLAAIMGVLTLLIGATIILAYLYGFPLMYGGGTVPMAATTAINFMFLGIAIVASAGEENFLIRRTIGNSTAAVLSRALIPLIVTAILLESLLTRYIPASFAYEALVMAILVIFVVLVTATVIDRLAKSIGGNIDEANRKLRQSMKELKQSDAELRQLAESMPQIVWITRPDGWNIYFNQKWMDYTGLTLEESLGHGWNKPFHPDDQQRAWDAWQNAVNNLAEYSLECRLRRADGIYKWWLIRGVPVLAEDGTILKWFGTCTDIDGIKKAEEERLNLERQLQQAQKLESLGVLAGGIAHDFNNILMAIIGNADLALMRINKESPIVDNLHRIEESAARAADLAKQMLAYSGKGKFIIENIDLNRLLEEMLNMLQVSISKKAVLRLNLHKHLPTVEADATQMRQIVMNLVINASEAIDDKSGVISITTGCMDCDESYLKDILLDENITEGLYVYLEIADTGCGMDKETMAKLFDPFFTTKFTGRGLGMSAVLGIVRGHKGGIKVYSEPNKGTTFKILLPASNRPPEIFNDGPKKDDWRGSGTVLLVDDEETVRGIGKEMLLELGFTPITASDGRQAVDIYKTTPDVAFIILDLTMPHMDGAQCFRELKQLNPDVKVIMSSGYNEQEVTQKFAGKGLAGFIQKPYKLSELKEVLRKI